MNFSILTLDVWGNCDDGWEVNQSFHTGNIIDIAENDGPQDIVTKLKLIYRFEAVTVEMHERDIFVNNFQDDEPLFHLRAVNK